MSTKIGTFLGLDVYTEPGVARGVIEFRNGTKTVWRVAVDHPYMQGTEIERTARAALSAEKADPTV